MTVCTCLWSPVGTTSLDPPYLVTRHPDCPVHGGEDVIYADLVTGRCSHTQAIDRLEELGNTRPQAVNIVVEWIKAQSS